jgi:hypothetical protein
MRRPPHLLRMLTSTRSVSHPRDIQLSGYMVRKTSSYMFKSPPPKLQCVFHLSFILLFLLFLFLFTQFHFAYSILFPIDCVGGKETVKATRACVGYELQLAQIGLALNLRLKFPIVLGNDTSPPRLVGFVWGEVLVLQLLSGIMPKFVNKLTFVLQVISRVSINYRDRFNIVSSIFPRPLYPLTPYSSILPYPPTYLITVFSGRTRRSPSL